MLRRPRSLPLDLAFIGLVWVVWAVAMALGSRWSLFAENWFMSVTMAFGSFVAGSTSQGGGAVAFPVMTLGFGIDPQGARDFSLMIQSVGMTSASIAILWRRIEVERTTLLAAGIGGAAGVLLGLEVLQPWFEPNPTKVFFVSLWLAFGAALWRIDHLRRPVRRVVLREVGLRSIGLLGLAGLAGGTVSGLLGSGLDILVFALLVLGFRICEKVATPTSVILMATTSLAGLLFRALGFGGAPIATETWGYWWVSVPIVAIGAPLGARFIEGRSHRFIVRLLLVLIVLQFVGALAIIPLDVRLVALAATTFILGLLLFTLVWRLGRRSEEGGDDG